MGSVTPFRCTCRSTFGPARSKGGASARDAVAAASKNNSAGSETQTREVERQRIGLLYGCRITIVRFRIWLWMRKGTSQSNASIGRRRKRNIKPQAECKLDNIKTNLVFVSYSVAIRLLSLSDFCNELQKAIRSSYWFLLVSGSPLGRSMLLCAGRDKYICISMRRRFPQKRCSGMTCIKPGPCRNLPNAEYGFGKEG
jgi:hypothetical protein